jgi:ABC-type multidrug transport system ATPase subunit
MRRRVEEVAREVDLAGDLDARFSAFSSGMRQRLTVARALLADPPIVLLDEPTRAVDPVHAEALRRFIRDHLVGRLKKTVILATNFLDEAWRLCDRIAVVNDGVVVALGPPGSLDDGLRRVDRYAVTVDRLDHRLRARVAAIPGVVVSAIDEDDDGTTLHVEIADQEIALTALCEALAAGEAVVRSFSRVEPSPVDVFQRVTRKNG